MDIETAELIVRLNGIKCCGICEHLERYDHDLGSEWSCAAKGDIELSDSPFQNVYIEIDCDAYKARKVAG